MLWARVRRRAPSWGSDVGTSVLLSKSVGQFVKNEDAKRLITSGAKKVIESIQSKSETPNNEVKNEAK